MDTTKHLHEENARLVDRIEMLERESAEDRAVSKLEIARLRQVVRMLCAAALNGVSVACDDEGQPRGWDDHEDDLVDGPWALWFDEASDSYVMKYVSGRK